jgi:hypothetical protein
VLVRRVLGMNPVEAGAAGGRRYRFLVAWPPSEDLLLWAKHLFLAAKVASQGWGEAVQAAPTDRASSPVTSARVSKGRGRGELSI